MKENRIFNDVYFHQLNGEITFLDIAKADLAESRGESSIMRVSFIHRLWSCVQYGRTPINGSNRAYTSRTRTDCERGSIIWSGKTRDRSEPSRSRSEPAALYGCAYRIIRSLFSGMVTRCANTGFPGATIPHVRACVRFARISPAVLCIDRL